MEQELAKVHEVYSLITTFLVNYGFQVVGAILIFLLGLLVAGKTANFVDGELVRNKVDVTLSHFAAGAVKILILAMVLIIVLGKIGISVTPFVAAVGALSLGAGLAMQGMLSNYSAGVAIILSRPFVVGDTIAVQGVSGVVKSVRLAYMILIDEDEVQITIPNKHIVGEIIHNSAADTIVEDTIDIAYSSDPEKAVALVIKACYGKEGVSNKRLPQAGIVAFGDSGITLGIRYWVQTEKLFRTRTIVNAAIFSEFKQNKIDIPFPQREVRLLQDSH